MVKIRYERWNPRGEAHVMVGHAQQIIAAYQQQGYNLTLRQLYYQFVARGLIANSDKSYKRLGEIINRARMAGWLDWSSIEDRTRNLAGLSHWDSPGAVVRSAAHSYHRDLWADQPVRIEIWVEKEALAGVIQRAANAWDLDYFSCRGYVSQSEQWRAGQRIHNYIRGGQRVVILHLGDHDPSGIDMTRDIKDRITHFICVDEQEYPPDVDTDLHDFYTDVFDAMNESYLGADPYDLETYVLPFEVRRIALNWDQIQQYSPPPNPAKITDSRSGEYIRRFGRESWELDALDPATLRALIDEHVSAEVDLVKYEAARDEQEAQREGLEQLAARPWDEVRQWLNERSG